MFPALACCHCMWLLPHAQGRFKAGLFWRAAPVTMIGLLTYLSSIFSKNLCKAERAHTGASKMMLHD